MKEITTVHLDFENLARSDNDTILQHMGHALRRWKKRVFPPFDGARIQRLDGKIRIALFNRATRQQVGVFCFRRPQTLADSRSINMQLRDFPQVRSISVTMENGNFARSGTMVNEGIPPSLGCERPVCDAGFDLRGFLTEQIKAGRTEGRVFFHCTARQRMNRHSTRECLAQLHGTYKIEYNESEAKAIAAL